MLTAVCILSLSLHQPHVTRLRHAHQQHYLQQWRDCERYFLRRMLVAQKELSEQKPKIADLLCIHCIEWIDTCPVDVCSRPLHWTSSFRAFSGILSRSTGVDLWQCSLSDDRPYIAFSCHVECLSCHRHQDLQRQMLLLAALLHMRHRQYLYHERTTKRTGKWIITHYTEN